MPAHEEKNSLLSRKLAQTYFQGLQTAYEAMDAGETWEHFASIVHGASQEDLERLLKLYPDAPESLLELLRLVDGTYYQVYGKEKVSLYALGSDYEEY